MPIVREMNSLGLLIPFVLSVLAVVALGHAVFRSFTGQTVEQLIAPKAKPLQMEILIQELRSGRVFDRDYAESPEKQLRVPPQRLNDAQLDARRQEYLRYYKQTLGWRAIGNLLTCRFCHATWAALGLVLLCSKAHGLREIALNTLAYSGAAMVAAALISRMERTPQGNGR